MVDFDLKKSLEIADELKVFIQENEWGEEAEKLLNESVYAIIRTTFHLEFWMTKYLNLYRDCENHLLPKQIEYSKELQIAQTEKRQNSTIYYKAKLDEVNTMIDLIRGNIREVKKEEGGVYGQTSNNSR